MWNVPQDGFDLHELLKTIPLILPIDIVISFFSLVITSLNILKYVIIVNTGVFAIKRKCSITLAIY